MKRVNEKGQLKKCELMIPNRKHYSLGAVFCEELNDDIFKLYKE